MTIREIYTTCKISLSKIYNSREAQNITEWLLCDVLNYHHRISLFEKFEQPINALQQKIILRKLRLLLNKKPIQQVIHKTWFCDMEFYIFPGVLIPRPETEYLCYTIIHENKGILNVLDIATGSGCIAIALKKYHPEWNIVATDISPISISIASCNANKNNVSINFLLDNMLNSHIPEKPFLFDIIVSNPPYIPISEKKQMNDNVVKYEPHEALFVPDDNPLLFYKAIINIAYYSLKKNGLLYLEVHESFADDVQVLFYNHGYNAFIYTDLHNKKRFIKAIKNE